MPPRTDAFARRLGHALAAGALAALLPLHASAIGLLNDTGQTRCVDASGAAWAANCNSASTGGLAGQDARFGRDAAAQTPGQLTKNGGGVAGFDFTPIALNGQVTALGGHACVFDSVTNLLWSAETLGPMNYADALALVGETELCGHDGGWRLPTRRELMSIVDYGAATSPAIDTAYFPDTQDWYWTSDDYAADSTYAWEIYFGSGIPEAALKTAPSPSSPYVRVRLVRTGHQIMVP